MTKAYRSADEQELLSPRNLERRIANLERSAAGLPIITSAAVTPTTLTGVAQDIPGLAVSLTRPGLYLLVATVDCFWSVAGVSTIVLNFAASTGTFAKNTQGLFRCDSSIARATVGMSALLRITAASTVTINAVKTPVAGTSSIEAQSLLTAIRTGPA